MTVVVLVIALAACLAVQAFFAAGEIAIVTADEIKAHVESRRGAQDAKLLASLLENRDRLLAAVLTVTNLANAVAAAALTTFLYAITPALGFLAPFVLAPLTLTLGESIPKLMTLRRPLEVARIAAAPLKAFADVLAPLIAVETEISRWIRRTIGVSPEVQSVFMTREDLARLLHRPVPQTERDAIQPSERQIISRIFRFSRVEARKVMVPLVRTEAIPDDTPL